MIALNPFALFAIQIIHNSIVDRISQYWIIKNEIYEIKKIITGGWEILNLTVMILRCTL